MKRFRLHQSIPLLTLMIVGVTGFQFPTTATTSNSSALKTEETSTPSDRHIAQSQSALCRRVAEQQGLAVHARPTPNSPVVGGVGYNTEITLGMNTQGVRGPDGRTWIEITAPTKGYISNGFPDGSGNLVDCSEGRVDDPKPSPNRNLCRQVDLRAAPRGVTVREKASRLSERVGGVSTGEQVKLVENYKLIPDPNGESRNWVEITEPVRGFISANTLILCR